MEDSAIPERKALTKRAIVLGLCLGVLYTFLAVYLSYKVGIVALGGIFLLGYVLLQLTGKYNYKENVIIIVIVTSCLLPAFEISDNIAALVIYNEYSSLPVQDIIASFPLLFFIGLVGSVLGIFLLMPFKKHFLGLKWPFVQPSAQMVKAIGGSQEQKKRAFGSMFLSALLTLGTTLGGVKSLTLPFLPSFIGLEVSPMMAGLGFFITFSGFLLLAIGAAYSIGIWLVLEGAIPNLTFTDHLTHPAIFSLAIGMMVTTALINIALNRRAFRSAFGGLRRSKKNPESSIPTWMTPVSMVLLPISMLIGTYFILGYYGIALETFYIVLIGVPIVLIAAFFVAMAMGETGFSTSFSVDMVLVLSILLFAPDIAILLLGFSALNALEMSSTRTMRSLKLGSLTEVSEKDMLKAILISIVPGAAIGAGTIWIFANIFGGLGTGLFPCPTAYVTGGYVLGVREAIVRGFLPEMYDFRFLLAGIAIAIIFSVVQSRKGIRGISPITLAIGMLIPPLYIFPMALGAVLDLYLKKKYGGDPQIHGQQRTKWTVITSGLFAGEGIILMLFSFGALLSLFL
ncbi:MAG: OPT/YSL family transporter [Candidatus Bathyarchaeota archaeon]|nr:MAG: OPT/YSL family transporter [Candidatus Bathyarchaeota archaeon]